MAIVIMILCFSCNFENNTVLRNKNSYQLMKGPEQCFNAIFQKDSAFLKFKTTADGKIRGRLIIKYAEPEPLALEKNFYHGEITGKFANDTLFADYFFTNGAHTYLYRNPIALLKKSGKLFLGFGVTVNYLGKTWFPNHSAINFNKSRFQFVPADCAE